MSEKKNKLKNRNIVSLLIGIILIVTSIFTFIKPVSTFLMLSYILGIVCMTKGIHFIYLYFKQRNEFKLRANTILVFGIILIVAGIIFVVKPIFANNIFTYLIAIWFIYDAIDNFISIGEIKDANPRLFILSIISNILILIGATIIIINPWITIVSLSIALGITLLISGIMYLIRSLTAIDKKEEKSSRNLH